MGSGYPQAECQTVNRASSLSSWNFPDFQPNLIFNLQKKAKQTDVLSNAAINATGLLLSYKTKEILNRFNLINHKYYEVQINQKDEVVKYYWLHLCEPELINSIDYRKSTFYRTEFTFREEKINLSSYKEYENLKSIDKNASFGIDLDEIYVTEKFNTHLDLFTFLPFDDKIYVSQRLKEALINENITGLKFDEATTFHL
ncbi:MAG: hypothetical protein HOP30_11240 [Cyclobacteriaceae bacterium]|nr:hypothetical protein [Cyclobacteriaceae bacterium]